jgi:hypothetical protein
MPKRGANSKAKTTFITPIKLINERYRDNSRVEATAKLTNVEQRTRAIIEKMGKSVVAGNKAGE